MKSSLGSRPHVGRLDGAMAPEILFAFRNRSFRTTGLKPAARRCLSLWRPPRWRFARRGLHPRYHSNTLFATSLHSRRKCGARYSARTALGACERQRLRVGITSPHARSSAAHLIQNKITVRSVEYSRSYRVSPPIASATTLPPSFLA